MKIYGNRNTLWIEISKEEFGEDVKLECKGEMLVGETFHIEVPNE